MEQEHPSVKLLWRNYLSSIGETDEGFPLPYSSWFFCSTEKQANNLAMLVRNGIKKATTSLYCLYEIEKEPLPATGQYNIITNWNGIAACIIQTKKVTVLPFDHVTEEMARTEGEGDQSLAYWKQTHQSVFTKELMDIGKKFTPGLSVVFEEFEMVYPPLA